MRIAPFERRSVLVTITALALALLWASNLPAIPLKLVWNASASAPRGLYWVVARERQRRGDMVVAWLPAQVRRLAAERGYLPARIPLVKRVAAIAGDRVCAAGHRVLINGTSAAWRYRSDPAGRALPWWSGCRRLMGGETLLLTAPPRSFDGRYFGISRAREIVGRAVPLWLS